MKKFEEEVKRPSNAGIDPFSKRDVSFEKLSSKFTKGAQTLKEWKEYAFKAEDKIRELESQLKKQQPEIPEFVAKYIEKYKGARTVYGILDKISRNQKVYPKLYEWVFKNEERQEIFAQAWLNGYTVEKPQLFYLRDELTGQFLAKDNQFKDKDRYFFWTGADPLTHSIGTAWKLTFTQQEIDSMETGNYEKIEVEE